ncbi:DEKNAAC105064 [Brettanomyces naardenensis]|uniref:DEKNAAC105064 n=1 Tax=Brettanomyces naardenensis TaxID=13370 RepID=A0A448YS02_BRENA|nr:DEKNAAC105064 [Brettanomyces naardenensis]
MGNNWRQLKTEIENLEQEIDVLSERYEELKGEEQRQEPTVDNEDRTAFIPNISKVGNFDDLISGLMTDGLAEQETQDSNKKDRLAKRRKLEQAESLQNYQSLKNKYLEDIQLENCYRLGGITAFPVNDPSGKEDRFLGIRYDVFDPYRSKYTSPHYIILKKTVKNNDWFVFKTTLPKFIPINTLASQYLNIDMFKFVSEIRRHLLQLELKRSVFTSISEKLVPPSRIDSDLSFTKVNVNVLNKFELVLVCGPSEITSVIVIGQNSGILNKVTRRKLELGLRGSRFAGFDHSFFEIMGECGIRL